MDDEALVEDRLAELLGTHDPVATPKQQFLEAQYDLGLAWVDFAPGFGGLGVERRGWQSVVDERIASVGGPTCWTNFIGVAQGAAAVHAYGTDEQKRRWLRPSFSNEEIWCQLFSEPGAGSDLAGLSTMAVRDGDEWVVNGQKVWTSYARHARWAILLARTNPDVPKHRGLTFFILDMHLPGVNVVPIRQADGTDHHFNEVFLDEVRAPDSLRLGDVGMGWAISVEGLSAEREGQGHTKAPFEDLLEAFRRRRPASEAQERVWRDRMAGLWIRAEAGHHTVVRLREQRKQGGAGNDGAITKIAATELQQDMHMLALELLGAEGQVGGEYQAMLEGTAEDTIQLKAIRSRAASIEGGTNQILRNIIGERILGLPGDVRVDKDIAWKDVRRS